MSAISSADQLTWREAPVSGRRSAVRSVPGVAGRVVHWGVREHAMGACMNGLAAHGGIRPFGSTFLVFFDYMKPSIRLAALMGLPVIYIGTHDSIGVGEDGPTHQPVDQLPMLRAIPGLVTLRPADANETVACWKVALERRDGPTAIVLTRQKVPVLPRLATAADVGRGAYVAHEPAPGAPGHPDRHRLGSRRRHERGGAARARRRPGTGRVDALMGIVRCPAASVSGPGPAACHPGARRHRGGEPVRLGAVGRRREGAIVAMRSFGASAPAERLFAEFGITPAAAAAAVRDLLTRSDA